MMWELIYIILMIVIVFIPSSIAFIKKKSNKVTILISNIAIGGLWIITELAFFVWLGILVWGFWKDKKEI